MITLIVKINIISGDIDKVIVLTKIVRDKSLLEYGCVAYTINYNPDNTNEIILVEIYKDQESLDAHKLTSHFNEWRDAVQQYMASNRIATRYDSI